NTRVTRQLQRRQIRASTRLLAKAWQMRLRALTLDGANILSTVISSAAKNPCSMALESGHASALGVPVTPTTIFSAASVPDPNNSVLAKIRPLARFLDNLHIAFTPSR